MQLLTIPETAQILRCAVTSLQCDITRNPKKLPPFARIGGRILFVKSDVESFVLSKIVNRENIVNVNETKHAHLNSVNKKRGRPRKATPSAQTGGAACL